MNSDHRRKGVGAIVGGMLILSASSTFAAGPELPPAEYKTPPVGTIIEYDTWTCEVIRSEEFLTERRDSELGHVSIYGTIQPFGKMAKAPPLKLLDSVIFSGDWGDRVGPSSQIVSEQGLRVSVEAEQTPQYSDFRRAGHHGGDFMFVRK